MSYKFLRIAGIILTILGVISIVAAVILWFLNYYFMQEGYYELGTPIMNTFGVFCCLAFLIYVGPILFILSFVMDKSKKNTSPNVYHPKQIPKVKNSAPQPSLHNDNHIPQPPKKHCPQCSAVNDISSNFCMMCGHRF